MTRCAGLFDNGNKPLIAMAHVPALPGTPLYDRVGGMDAIIEEVRTEVSVLVKAGFDAVMFCNENDRPYELHAGPESAAFMTRVAVECRPDSIPFGMDFLWDPRIALAAAIASGAAFMREVTSGVWESDMGLWNTDSATLLRERRRLDADDLGVFVNVTPEFASTIGRRTPAQIAESVAVSSLPDAILVSGSMAGAGPSLDVLTSVRAAVPQEIPVLLNTGARADTIAEMLKVVDGCIVGTSLKQSGLTWNRVDPRRAHQFVAAARAA
jgi:membrane complex biogenesis BtpA family protein